MRYSLTFFLIFCIATFGLAQDTEVKKPKVRMKGDDRLMLDLFHSNWTAGGLDEGVAVEGQSRGLSVSILYDYPIGKSNFSLAAGIGFTTHNIFLNSSVSWDTLTDGSTISRLRPFAEGYSFKMNKLSFNFIDFPIEVRWKSDADDKGRRAKISAGARFGLMVDTHSKTIDDAGKRMEFGFPNVNEFIYGVNMRVGWHRFAVYGYYGFSTVFKEDKGPRINPWAVGLTYSLL